MGGKDPLSFIAPRVGLGIGLSPDENTGHGSLPVLHRARKSDVAEGLAIGDGVGAACHNVVVASASALQDPIHLFADLGLSDDYPGHRSLSSRAGIEHPHPSSFICILLYGVTLPLLLQFSRPVANLPTLPAGGGSSGWYQRL